MEDGDACGVISSIFKSFEPINENFCRLSGADISDDATHGLTLLLSRFFTTVLYFFTPPLDVLLFHPADRQRPFWYILRDRGAGTDRGIVSHLDRSHQLHIRPHKNPIADDRLVFLESIIVTEDR